MATEVAPLGALPSSGSRHLVSTSSLVVVTRSTTPSSRCAGRARNPRLEELRRAVDAGPSDPRGAQRRSARADAWPRRASGRCRAARARLLSPLPAQGFTLDFPGGAGGAVIGPAVARTVERAGTSRTDTHAIKVACGEACANAIEHAHRPGDAAFQIEASRVDSDVLIAVRDFGGGESRAAQTAAVACH